MVGFAAFTRIGDGDGDRTTGAGNTAVAAEVGGMDGAAAVGGLILVFHVAVPEGHDQG